MGKDSEDLGNTIRTLGAVVRGDQNIADVNELLVDCA